MGGRFSDLWRGLFDAFVRNNRALPPIVALLALLLFVWVAAGAFLAEPYGEIAPGDAELVQARDPAAGVADAPEVEDRDADSFAAYRNKDPFRQLLAPADSDSESDSETTPTATPDDGTNTGSAPSGPSSSPPPSEEQTIVDDVGDQGANTSGGGGDPGGSGGSVPPGDSTTADDGDDRPRTDSDGDGLSTRREERLGLDPRNPDTDGDGIQDGEDDSDGDDVPDGQQGGGGSGTGGAEDGGGSGGGTDDLFDSGGTLNPR